MKESYKDAVQQIVDEQGVSWREAELIYADAQADAAEDQEALATGN